jgi:mitochondrial splicing suppressor protein 51
MRNSVSYTCRRCLSTSNGNPYPSTSLPWRPPYVLSGRLSTQSRNTQHLTSIQSASRQELRRNLDRRRVSTSSQKGQIIGGTSQAPHFASSLASTTVPSVSGRPLLLPNNLFHLFSSSPSLEIRRRAAFIKQNAYCPHPDHHQTRLTPNPDNPEARKAVTPPAHVSFECPDCGIPVSCCEEHWADDYESHLEICDTLRQINEDDHDLRSGRFFPEFEYPGPQIEEAMVNMTNWDTFLYSREFNAINDERSLRQATRLLSYPVSIASVLHELSPYNIKVGGRLTVEGLKSLSGR